MDKKTNEFSMQPVGFVRTDEQQCWAEFRPNPIALTVCQILEMDEKQGIVKLAYIDALDGTPVLDLKACFPVCDRCCQLKSRSWQPGMVEKISGQPDVAISALMIDFRPAVGWQYPAFRKWIAKETKTDQRDWLAVDDDRFHVALR